MESAKPMKRSVARSGLAGLLLALMALPAATMLAQPSSTARPSAWVVNGPDGIPIDDFIAQVADITGKTVVVDPRIKNQEVTVISTVELDAEGVYELFLTVLKVNGLGAVETDGVVSVIQQNEVKKAAGPVTDDDDRPADMLITRVVPVNYVASSELVKTLRPLTPQTGHIAAIENPNVVIIADQAANVRRLLELIDEIDIFDKDDVVRRPLEYAWVGTIAQLLEAIAPGQVGSGATGPRRVTVVANERDNSLILSGRTHAIAETLRLIDKLDVAETTTNAAEVIHLNYADAADVAAILESIINQEVGEGAPLAIIQADESLNAIVVRADPTTTNQILATVSQLDVRREQVLIEAALVEVSVSVRDEQGVEFAAGDGSSSGVPLLSSSLNGIVANLLRRLGEVAPDVGVDSAAAVAGFESPTIAFAQLKRNGLSIGAIISALSTDTRANLLSTPSILTLDNEEASNVAGQQIPFRTGSFTTTTDGASNPFQTINRENVGVELKVTPHIHENTSIRLAFYLEVGNVVESTEATGIGVGNTGFADVVTAKRTLETTILAEDRQVVLLGGLIQDDNRDVIRRVPLLSNIPVVGRAFRSRRETLIKRCLLVFLRPTVIFSGDEAQQLARYRYDGIYRLQGDSVAGKRPNLEDVFETEGVH